MKYRFVDLVDVDRFRSMMHCFHEATGLPYGLIDTDNNILCGEGWQDICTQFHRRNPASVRRCYESDHFIAEHLRRAPFIGYRCLNGLIDYATPVVIDGEHVATMFIGQFLHEPPDLDTFRRQAGELGFDEAAYLDALGRVPVIPRERAEAAMRFYAELAQMLAANGLDRLRQKEADRQLEAVNQGLEQRSRELEAANKELEEFSYSISHDLRTPLRAIAGFSQILLADYGPRLDGEGRRLLDVVRDSTLRMGELIDAIVGFLRVGRRLVTAASIDMAALTAEVWAELLAGQPQRRLHLRIGELPAARGDRALVRQALSHLLANALKFTAPKPEAEIEVGATAGEGENIYWVEDTGVGFDMQFKSKLFKVFERLHSPGEFPGAGIGLATVKRIVLRLGGRVWAEGAAIHFTLPTKGT